MDHTGDMLNYLQTGMEMQGYPGCGAWQGIDRYKEAPPKTDEWEITDQGEYAQAVMYAKDQFFLVTIEHLGFGETKDLTITPRHAATASEDDARISAIASAG